MWRSRCYSWTWEAGVNDVINNEVKRTRENRFGSMRLRFFGQYLSARKWDEWMSSHVMGSHNKCMQEPSAHFFASLGISPLFYFLAKTITNHCVNHDR